MTPAAAPRGWRSVARRAAGPWTLRQRIVSLAIGAAVAVMLLFSVPVWLLEQRSADHDVQQQAAAAAGNVADYVSAQGSAEGSADGAGVDLRAYVDRVDDRDDAVPVTVVAPDGTVIGRPLPGPVARSAAARIEGTGTGTGTGDGDDGDGDSDRDDRAAGRFLRTTPVDVDAVPGGHLARIEVATPAGPTTVVAFADDGRATGLVATRLLPLAATGVLALLLIGVGAELVSRRLVRDLGRAADLADTLAAGDVRARVPLSGTPEVRRVAQALNGLAGRIDELLCAERETVADLSHRLRTPLMAVRLDVEALPDSPQTRELDAHVDQLERTLTQVIRQARRAEREGSRPACRPAPVVGDAVDFWRPLVEDQQRRLEVRIDPGLAEVRCADDDLRAAVDALVENCLAHSPEGAALAISAYVAPSTAAVADPPAPLEDTVAPGPTSAPTPAPIPASVVVEVCDQGPGFPAAAVRRGRSDRGSTGLGLDIARACAQSTGGFLTVSRETLAGGTWTAVRLHLGPA